MIGSLIDIYVWKEILSMQSLRIAQSLISLFGFSTMSFFFNTLYLPPISIQMIHDFVAERHYNPHFCVKSNYRSLVQSSYGSCCLFRLFFFFNFFFLLLSLSFILRDPQVVYILLFLEQGRVLPSLWDGRATAACTSLVPPSITEMVTMPLCAFYEN